MNTLNKLEAFLFIKGEPQLKKDIEIVLGITRDELEALLSELTLRYQNTGITVIQTDTECALVTSTEVAPFVEEVEKNERGGELSKASLETLSIILYKNGATRSEVDYIRGVNSSFILRNLYIRGLITKADQEKRTRSPKYIPTTETLRFLGITSIQELPGYEEMTGAIEESLNTSDHEAHE